MNTVRVSVKGQVVIPKWVREQLGIHEGTICRVEMAGEGVLLVPTRPAVQGWRHWEGILAGTNVLKDHLEEHRRELDREGRRP